MMCQRIGLPPTSIIGFGRTWDSSEMRVPKPPARMTHFTTRAPAQLPRAARTGSPHTRGPARDSARDRPSAARGIAVDAGARRSVRAELAVADPESARAELLDRRHVVADEENGAPAARGRLHPPEALPLELDVADDEHLVDEQDVRLEVG